MPEAALLIGQLAAQVGMARSALRYYEDAGLLTPAARTAAGYRLYAPGAVARIKFIRRASALGLRLSDIKALIESSTREPGADTARFQAFLGRKVVETQAKIAELTKRNEDLLRVEARLRAEPPPGCCHLGDCSCWFPDAE